MPGGTKLRDVVDYVLPFGPVGSMAQALFVRRQLKAIFDYRYQVIQQKFGTAEELSARPVVGTA